jgi:hypothetical protein
VAYSLNHDLTSSLVLSLPLKNRYPRGFSVRLAASRPAVFAFASCAAYLADSQSPRFSLDGKHVKSIQYTPGYIYVIAIVLALPATWLVVGRSGEDVPGMIAMVVSIVFSGIFIVALSWLRRRLQNRRSAHQNSPDHLG